MCPGGETVANRVKRRQEAFSDGGMVIRGMDCHCRTPTTHIPLFPFVYGTLAVVHINVRDKFHRKGCLSHVHS